MKATLIKADGTVTEVSPENGTDFTIKEVYKLLNCRIVEVLPLYNGKIMIIDEEGKLRDKIVVNKYATELYHYGKRKMSAEEIVSHYNKLFGGDFAYIDLSKESGIPKELADAVAGDVIVCEPEMFK